VEGLPNATPSEIQLEDVLEAVTRSNGHPKIESLCKHCATHSLLVWRINELWTIYHKASELRKDLTVARERLEWQLARIYRARNHLIHRGNESRSLPHLTNNLQYYFSTTVSRLLHGLGPKKDKTSHEAAYRWRAQSDFVIDQLATNPSGLKIEDLVPTPKRRECEPLWS